MRQGAYSWPLRGVQACAGSGGQSLCCAFAVPPDCFTHSPRRLQISIADFEFIQRLGDGSFSTVVLGRYKGDGRCYAVKIVNKSVVLRNKVRCGCQDTVFHAYKCSSCVSTC
jgi:serine/threonine protein kinase